MNSPAPTETSDRSIRRLLSRAAKGGGVSARLALIFPLIGGGLLLAQAYVLAHILHEAIIGSAPVSNLLMPAAGLAALLALRLILGFLGELFAGRASEASKLALRRTVTASILARRPNWTAGKSSGALSGLVVEQIEALDGYLSRYLPAMAQAAILPIAFAIVAFPVDWVVGLLFLFTAPLIPVFMALAGWGAEAASRRQADALSRLTGRFADRLCGLTTLKLFGRDAAETEAAAAASDELRARTLRVMRIAFLSSAVLEFFAALGVAGVALYVGLTFLDLVTLRATPLTLEAGLFCLLMAPEVYQPLRLLAANYHDRASAKAAMAEIVTQLDAPPELAEAPPAAAALPPLEANQPVALRLAHVSIAAPDDRSVITQADLDIAPGEHVAILGASGSGKSTLLEAIAGLRDFTGTIEFDGQALAGIEPSVLRRRLGMLGQRPTIFAQSIAGNIGLGRRGACHAAIRHAAQRAHVTDFADPLPNGLATMLGEGGIGLSGGEVHRVALARLYLRDPGLLLLDEPTAHLDDVTEAAVLDGLLAFARGRTMIVATHSTAVAARMDRCFRIVDGRLLPAPRPVLRLVMQRGAA